MKKTTTKKLAEKKKPKREKIAKKVIKKTKTKKRVKRKEVEKIVKPARYFETVGRRKTAVARVRLFTQGEKVFLINDKPYQEYFSTLELQQVASASLETMKCIDRFRVLVKVKGGGSHSQAEAVRHGIARALVKFTPGFRRRLRRVGYITRDPRMRERKKFGLKRARRAPQWQKR